MICSVSPECKNGENLRIWLVHFDQILKDRSFHMDKTAETVTIVLIHSDQPIAANPPKGTGDGIDR